MNASTISNLNTKDIKKDDILYQAEFVSNRLGEEAQVIIHTVKVIEPIKGREGWFSVELDGVKKNTNLAFGNFKTEKEAVKSLQLLFKEMLDTVNKKLKEYK